MSEPIHTYPLGDVIVHELDGDECICGPDVEYVDGGKLVVHHALDGREHAEPDHERDDCPVCT